MSCQKKFDTDVDLASWKPVDRALCALVDNVDGGHYPMEFEVVVRVDGPKEVVRAVIWSKMFSGIRRKGVLTVSQL